MNDTPHWLDVPRNQRRLWIIFLVVLALTVLAQFIWPVHGHFAFEALPGIHALYGFVVCALMIGVAKLLALWLKRGDTYYTQREQSDDAHNGVPHDG